jgi:hypothetical protein
MMVTREFEGSGSKEWWWEQCLAIEASKSVGREIESATRVSQASQRVVRREREGESVSGTRVARRVQAGVGVCALEKRNLRRAVVGRRTMAGSAGSSQTERRVATAVQQ